MTYAKLLDLRRAARYAGISYRTARNYHALAVTRRRAGESRPGDWPEPDETFGRSPVWKVSTMERWKQNRPGRGAGGGRPWRRATDGECAG